MNNNNVLIVGRTNVGKSTLFNRLSKKTKSISLEQEGVTRDFLKDQIKWKDKNFYIIDSGGLRFKKDSKKNDKFQELITEQVISLIDSSNIIIFMVDGKTGLTVEDLEIAKLLHKYKNKKVLLAINKIDVKESMENIYQFNRLGFKDIFLISCEHNNGIDQILDKIVTLLEKKGKEEELKTSFKVSFIGKPNVGKSSLMNLLLKKERTLVSDIPGTTREAIAENITFYKESIELTDTPGIRRKKSVKENIETLMVKSSFYALKNSDIVALLIDGENTELSDQDLKLAFYAFKEQYKSLVLIINKSDLITPKSRENLFESLKDYNHLIKNIKVIEISCKNKKNIGKIIPIFQEIFKRYNKKYSSAELTELFIDSLIKKPLYHKKELLKIFKAKQIQNGPIVIELTVNNPDWFKDSQLSYLENILRKKHDLTSIAVKFVLKKAK